jgi:hypothetical protein
MENKIFDVCVVGVLNKIILCGPKNKFLILSSSLAPFSDLELEELFS